MSEELKTKITSHSKHWEVSLYIDNLERENIELKKQVKDLSDMLIVKESFKGATLIKKITNEQN